MTLTLIDTAVDKLRAYIETGEMLAQTLRDAGFKPMLQLHADDDGAQIILMLAADPARVRQLLLDKHITHEPVDFVPTPARIFASYKVALFGHEIAIVVDHETAAAPVAP